MITRSVFCFLLVCFFTRGYGQQIPSADTVLKQAVRTASLQNKNVFIIFHASWCGWCHKMDSSMNDKSCKKFFDDNYIIRHLTVSESKNRKHLENPGAAEMLARYSGPDDGIPFWLIFDQNGNLLADSHIRNEDTTRGNNTGCPASRPEVDYFINVLKKTSRLTEQQLAIIEKRFRKNESE